jgi:hypothetical protein
LWPWHGCLRKRGRVNFLEVEVLFDARTSLPPPTRFYISGAGSTNEKQIFLDECHAPEWMFIALYFRVSYFFLQPSTYDRGSFAAKKLAHLYDVIVHARFFILIHLITCYHFKVIFRGFFIRNQIFLNIIIEADDNSIHLMSQSNRGNIISKFYVHCKSLSIV